MLEYYRFKQVYDLFSKGLFTDAYEQLSKLQRRYVALCSENTAYKSQIQEYEDILYLARNLSFDGTLYWLVTGCIKQGPFCPVCYDQDGLLVRLTGAEEERHCSACLTPFRQPRIHRNIYATAVAQDCHTEISEILPKRESTILKFKRKA